MTLLDKLEDFYSLALEQNIKFDTLHLTEKKYKEFEKEVNEEVMLKTNLKPNLSGILFYNFCSESVKINRIKKKLPYKNKEYDIWFTELIIKNQKTRFINNPKIGLIEDNLIINLCLYTENYENRQHSK